MDRDTLLDLVIAGVENGRANGVTYEHMASIAGWDASMLSKIRNRTAKGDPEKLRLLYRFLLRHRFVTNSTADVANEVYAIADSLASDAPFKEKFFYVREFTEKYGTKETLLSRLEKETGEGEIEVGA